jgi:hypothetical protein
MDRRHRGYPLGALFVAVTVSAVMIAGVTPLVRSVFSGEEDVGRFLAAIGIGAICGMVMGVVVGAFQSRKGLGLTVGVSTGTLIGAVAGIVALLPAKQLGPATAAMTAGSALIIGVALVMRRSDT